MNKEKLLQWKKSYGIRNIILRGLYTKLPIVCMSNNNLLRRMNWQMRARKRLKKYIHYSAGNPELENNNKHKKCIWVLWFQGLDKAPPIVHKCYKSIQLHMKDSGYQIVLLTENNMFDYIHLPDNIIKKWKNGNIGNAAFSDLCRITLLCEYGGLWLDATTLLTGKIDEEILNSEFFFFQASFLDFTATKISSWFISANSAGNSVLLSIRDTLLDYWNANDVIDDYFIFHLVVAELSENAEIKKQFDKIPYFTNTYPLLLGRELNNTFNEQKFTHYLKFSNIHKLTYKGLNENINNSFYKYILEMEM